MVAMVALVVLSPLILLMAILVKRSSRGPVFHVAERVGKDGRIFPLLKFRTMRMNAAGPGITRQNDPRVTRVGRWLRQYKLDELPQLINVVKGEMSLVGPRPEDPRYVAQYTAEQRKILTIRPGITGVASLQYRNEETLLTGENWEYTYRTVILPDKLRLEFDYLNHRTLSSDIGVLWRTLLILFLRR